jgi:hypothetical protein
MTKTMRAAAVAAIATLLLGGAGAALAGVNCGLIKKDIEMGRTPEDIAERMVIPVEEVRKCMEAEDGKTVTTDDAAAGEGEEKKAEE